MKEILNYLDKLFENPKCELDYNSDYELLINIMLSAQTTDKRVNIVTQDLYYVYNTLKKLASANTSDIKEIIKTIGFSNKKSENVVNIAKRLINDGYYDKVPEDIEYLQTLPGVGLKSASVFLSEYYHHPLIGVDTHVFRVSNRLNLSKDTDSIEEVSKKLYKYFKNEDISKIGMQLVLFGRYHCKSKNPNCDNCELKNKCSYKK